MYDFQKVAFSYKINTAVEFFCNNQPFKYDFKVYRNPVDKLF